MSAVVNGKDWIANFTTYYRGTGEWNYDGFRNDSSRIEIHLNSVVEGTFTMDSINGAFIFYFKGDKLYVPTQGAGTFTISSVKNGIVSGKFEIVAVNVDDGDSVNITDGLFDGFPGE